MVRISTGNSATTLSSCCDWIVMIWVMSVQRRSSSAGPTASGTAPSSRLPARTSASSTWLEALTRAVADLQRDDAMPDLGADPARQSLRSLPPGARDDLAAPRKRLEDRLDFRQRRREAEPDVCSQTRLSALSASRSCLIRRFWVDWKVSRMSCD